MIARYMRFKLFFIGPIFFCNSDRLVRNSKKIQSRTFYEYFKNMPKSNTAAAELKEQRLKSKNASPKKVLFAPSEIYLCVLGNGANNSPRALYMFTDHGRYVYLLIRIVI